MSAAHPKPLTWDDRGISPIAYEDLRPGHTIALESVEVDRDEIVSLNLLT